MTYQSVVLISAGASGIGLACARALAESGHRVLTLDIDAEAVARFQDEFGKGSAVVCDVADAAQVEAAGAERPHAGAADDTSRGNDSSRRRELPHLALAHGGDAKAGQRAQAL